MTAAAAAFAAAGVLHIAHGGGRPHVQAMACRGRRDSSMNACAGSATRGGGVNNAANLSRGGLGSGRVRLRPPRRRLTDTTVVASGLSSFAAGALDGSDDEESPSAASVAAAAANVRGELGGSSSSSGAFVAAASHALRRNGGGGDGGPTTSTSPPSTSTSTSSYSGDEVSPKALQRTRRDRRVVAYYRKACSLASSTSNQALLLGNWGTYTLEVADRTDPVAALSLLERAVALDPTDGMLTSKLATCYEVCGLNRTAKDYHELACRIAPHSSYVLAAHARYLWQQSMNEAAMEYRSAGSAMSSSSSSQAQVQASSSTPPSSKFSLPVGGPSAP